MKRSKKREALRLVDGVATYELLPEEKERRGRYGLYAVHPMEEEVYDPPPEKRISAQGAWVLLLRLPNIPIQEHLSRGQLFYAKQQEGADPAGFNARGDYKVMIRTPWGECGLWPYEYSVPSLEKILGWFEAKELVFHPFQGEPRFNDALFYLRSRGIGLEEALPMALGTFEEPVGWFEPPAELRETIEDVFGREESWPFCASS